MAAWIRCQPLQTLRWWFPGGNRNTFKCPFQASSSSPAFTLPSTMKNFSHCCCHCSCCSYCLFAPLFAPWVPGLSPSTQFHTRRRPVKGIDRKARRRNSSPTSDEEPGPPWRRFAVGARRIASLASQFPFVCLDSDTPPRAKDCFWQ